MKTMTMFILLLMLSVGMKGQRFYISPGIGYDIGMRSDQHDIKSNEMGGGPHAIGEIGYDLTDRFSVALGFSFVSFSHMTFYDSIPKGIELRNGLLADRFRLLPMINVNLDKKLANLSLKMGLLIGVAGTIDRFYSYSIYNNGIFQGQTRAYLYYANGPSNGFMVGISNTFDISEHFGLFTQISYEYEKWTPMDDAKNYNFAHGFTVTSGFYLPTFDKSYKLSSVGILAGLKISIGKKKSE
ncbi:MAG: hypothetical protein WCL14_02770 [Bacteroidota bacterium]